MLILLLNSLATIIIIISTTIILLKERARFPYKILSIWLIISLLFLPLPILIDFVNLKNYNYYYLYTAPYMYANAPLLYLFIRSLLNNEKKFCKKDWLHFIPFLLHFIELIPFYVSLRLDTTIPLHEIHWYNFSALSNSKEGLFLQKDTHSLLKVLSSLCYFGLSVHVFFKYLKYSKSLNNSITQFILWTLIIKAFTIVLIGIYFVLNNPLMVFLLIHLPTSLSLILMLVLLLIQIINLSGLDDVEFSSKFLSISEMKLRENEIKLHAIGQSIDDMIVLLSPNYEILHFNKAAIDYVFLIMNKKLEKIKHVKKYESNPIFSWFFMYIILVIKEKKTITFEKALLTTKDGFKEDFSIKLTPIFDVNEDLIAITISGRNISHTKNIEIKNSQHQAALEDIAWRHSHLMRAPLANIIGLVNELTKPSDLLTNDPEKVQLLKYLQSEAKKLDQVIRDNVQKAVKNN